MSCSDARRVRTPYIDISGRAIARPYQAPRENRCGGSAPLIPTYSRGRAPGALPHATQTDLDAVMNAYADRPRVAVDSAALMELGEFRTGMEQCYDAALFHAREALAFSAIAARSLFRGWFGYCNSHAYQLLFKGAATAAPELFPSRPAAEMAARIIYGPARSLGFNDRHMCMCVRRCRSTEDSQRH